MYAAPDESTWEKTIDLAELAKVNRGDRVEVERIDDSTQELFEKTINLLNVGEKRVAEAEQEPLSLRGPIYVPENEDLRKVYLFAEALGGYEALNDLISGHSPGNWLSRKYGQKAQTTALSPREVRVIETYHAQIQHSLKNANRYLQENKLQDFTHEELHELYEILKAASARAKDLSRILGIHLIHEIDNAIHTLHEIRTKARSVEQSLNGIFFVNSEVMFIAPNELIRCVNSIFKGVGNSYVANNVDGVVLLAGRNLLIDVVSFYSYYGKHQIYNLFAKGGGTVNPRAISLHIRREIRKLFQACKEDNKLILTRIMKNVEREFELSVDAIQMEAEERAFEAVRVFIPVEIPTRAPQKKGWFQKVLGWFFS